MRASVPSVRVIAHRGASGRWPEHTRAAYLQAIADGADGLECDVQLTADGVAVLWHDATVDRTSDGTGPLGDHTLAALRGLDVLGDAVPPADLGGSTDQVLTLAELVALAVDAARPLTLAVELKPTAAAGWPAEAEVLRVLAAAGWDGSRLGHAGLVEVDLMSFHPGSLRELARLGAPTGRLMPLVDLAEVDELTAIGLDAPSARDLVADALALVDESGSVGPSVAFVRERAAQVRRWVEAGHTLRVWTVDSAADLQLCAARGVAEVTTNDPAAVRRMLQ